MSYDWLLPVLETGLNFAGNQYEDRNANSTNAGLYDMMRQQEDQNYANALAEHQARMGASNSARSAASQTDANRRGALSNAQKILSKSHKKSMGMLKPYAKAGKQMLPFHTNTAQGGLKGMDMLSAYMQSQPMIQAPQSMSQVNLGELPSTLFGGK